MTRKVPGVEEDGAHVPVTALASVTARLTGQLAVRPVAGETTVLRVTVPVKPPDGVIVIVELPAAPALKSAGDEAVIEKSAPTVKVNVADVGWEAVPGEPAPLMLTTNEPVLGEEQERLEVLVPLAVSDTGVGLNGLQVKPAGTVSVRPTEPTKSNVLVRVIVEEIDVPAAPLGDVALIVKSPT